MVLIRNHIVLAFVCKSNMESHFWCIWSLFSSISFSSEFFGTFLSDKKEIIWDPSDSIGRGSVKFSTLHIWVFPIGPSATRLNLPNVVEKTKIGAQNSTGGEWECLRTVAHFGQNHWRVEWNWFHNIAQNESQNRISDFGPLAMRLILSSPQCIAWVAK